MKDKIKEILNDERKKTIVILIIVIIILSTAILLAIFLTKGEEDIKEEYSTRPTTTKNILKGYKEYQINTNKNISYNIKSKYKFIYAEKEDNTIIITRSEDNYIYELHLNNGTIEFQEEKYNTKLNAYEYTSKSYTYKVDEKITDFIVVKDCEGANYKIAAKDAKNKVYVFESIEDEFDINYIIDNFKKIKTISDVSKIGYYTGNNDVDECYNRELIYLDTKGNIRYLSDKNSIFFNDSYYRYVGSLEFNNYIYVYKDGLMKLSDNNKYLSDKDDNIKYRGSFYEIKNNNENIYIIGTNGYLYVINDINNKSGNLLTRVNDNKIKRIGTKTITDANDFATDMIKIKIEFENNEIIEYTEIYEFELL